MVLTVIQLIISVLLICAILLQQRGTALSSAFGGDSSGSYSTRRGIQKFLFFATIILAILFLGAALTQLFIR